MVNMSSLPASESEPSGTKRFSASVTGGSARISVEDGVDKFSELISKTTTF
jgi:hypothetical protein